MITAGEALLWNDLAWQVWQADSQLACYFEPLGSDVWMHAVGIPKTAKQTQSVYVRSLGLSCLAYLTWAARSLPSIRSLARPPSATNRA